MSELAKKVILSVFSFFIIVTVLVSMFQDFSLKRLFFFCMVLLMVFILLKVPVLQKLRFERPRLILFLIAGIALIPRVIWVNLVLVDPKSDFYTLHTLSDALSHGQILYPKYISLFPHVFGYSRILSVIYGIFGSKTLTAVYFNIAVTMGILLLIYFLGKRFYDVKTGLTAAAIYACWPSQIFYNTLVLTEPVYILGILCILTLYCVVTDKIHSKPGLLLFFFGLGITAGFLKYIRPACLIVVLSIILHYLVIRADSHGNEKQMGLRWFKASAVLTLLIAYCLTSAALLRGIEKTIDMDVASQSGGFNLFVGMNELSKGKWSSGDSALLQPMIDKGLSSTEIQNAFRDMGIKRLKSMSVLAHLKHQINKNGVMWGSDSECLGYIQLSISAGSHINLSKHSFWLTQVCNGYYFIFVILSLLAFILLGKRLSPDSYLLYLYILGTVAVHMLVEVHGRYHYPVIPLICILAAAALTQGHIGFPVKKLQNKAV